MLNLEDDDSKSSTCDDLGKTGFLDLSQAIVDDWTSMLITVALRE